MKLLKHVRTFELVLPGPKVRAYIETRKGFRYGNRCDLKGENGICKWCEIAPVPAKGRFRLYCGKNCSESAEAWMNPQKGTAKAWILLFRQGGACARCGLDFSEEIDRRIRHYTERGDGSLHEGDTCELFTVAYNSGHLWHVDHVIPIHRGGEGIGLDNVQVLCVPCHHKKTVEDRRPVFESEAG